MTRRIVCERGNVREFNAAMREHAPDLFSLAKALQQRGMIDGLAGAKLVIGGSLPEIGGVKLEDMVIEPKRDETAAPATRRGR